MRFSVLLIVVTLLFSSCGFTVWIPDTKDKEDADPMTLLRRDIRQMRADNRVAAFDRQKDLNVLDAELKKMGENIFSLRKRDANFGEQISEIEMQIRLMGGSIEEEVNRIKEISERKNNNTLKELGGIRQLLVRSEEKEKKEALNNRHLLDRVHSVQETNRVLQKSSNDQIKALHEVSDRLTQLIEKVLPAVNDLAGRVDKQEDRFSALSRGVDLEGLNRRLSDLTNVIDVQRKSLEMLGNTITAQVDKQSRLLKKTLNRLQVLEAKVSKNK